MLRRIATFAGALLATASLGSPARAAEFYAGGTFVQSLGRDNSSGQIITNQRSVVGSDGDSSLGYGLTLGFGFDFEEVLPKKWDSWGTGFRVESEFIYGRAWDFVSDTRDVTTLALTPHHFFNEVEVWTFMPVNLFIDVPLRRPLSKIFGRVPRLEPFDLSFGFGAGVSHVQIDAFDNIGEARDGVYKFSVQGNFAVSYELSERTKVQFGYRYLDLGKTDAVLEFLGTNNQAGLLDLDLRAHELVLSARYAFHQKPLSEMEFPWPDSWPRWLGGDGEDAPKRVKPKKPKKKRKWLPDWLGGRRGP
jgi:hypothetical protein